MQPYSLKDRFKEISSFMGLVVLALSFYVGSKVTPGTPDAFAPLVLNVLGSLGIFMPEPAKSAALGLDVDALAAAMAKAVAASAKPLAVLVLVGASLGLAACQTQPVTAQLATACNALAGGYTTAAGYRAAGRLSAATISTLTDLEPVAKKSCDPVNPPADLAAALVAVTDAVDQLAKANAGVR